MENNFKNKVMSSLAWKFGERILAQLVTFIVSIALARILDPEHYGSISLIMVFITLANVFVTSGWGSALVQKKNADDTDFSSVFYFSIGFSIVLYIVLFIAAPYIANFYEMPELNWAIRVLSLRLPLAAVNTVQNAYVSKNLIFKRFFFATLGGTLGSAVVGIGLALILPKEYGIWALVAQYLFNSTVDTIILWLTVKWRPKLKFSFARLKILISYGWKLLVSSLLDNGYNELRSLIIGKMYTESDLAFYNRGQQFPNLISTNINASIESVIFPSIAKYQDDKATVKRLTRRAIKTSTYLMLPLMGGLAITARTIVLLLLGQKWLACVPYVQIFCFVYAFWPIHTANLQSIKALGRSDLFLIMEIIKKSIGILTLILTMKFGVLAIALGMAFTTIVSAFVNAFPNKKLMDYGYFQQMADLIPSLAMTLVMMAVVFPLNYLPLHNMIILVIQAIVGFVVYIILSKLFKIDSFYYIFDTVKTYLGKFKNRKAKSEQA